MIPVDILVTPTRVSLESQMLESIRRCPISVTYYLQMKLTPHPQEIKEMQLHYKLVPPYTSQKISKTRVYASLFVCDIVSFQTKLPKLSIAWHTRSLSALKDWKLEQYGQNQVN